MVKIKHFLILFVIIVGLFMSAVLLDSPVNFAEENFENAVRNELRYYSKPIYRSQLLNIIELDLSNKEISDLSAIKYFRNLEVLNLSNNNIVDVSQLKYINNLKKLDLGYNQIVDLEKANFNELQHLKLISLNLEHNLITDESGKETRLSDIFLLSHLTSLEELNLGDNDIQDFSALLKLKKLNSLDLRENNIENITFLKNNPYLKKLNLRDNSIQDIQPISYLDNLEYLNLHSNTSIESIVPLRNLTKLETLILRNVVVGDEIYLLSNMTKLNRLNLRNCSISDLSVLVRLMEEGALQDKPEFGINAYLDIRDNDYPQNPETLKSFIPYWDNIDVKYPFQINFSTLTPPIFSHKSGFYSDPLSLSVTVENEGEKIFYTLDGSMPTIDSFAYEESLVIGTDELVADKNKAAIVVRARSYSQDFGEVSPVVSHSYFFVEEKLNPASLPIISLIINPEFLFDHEVGIYPNFLERGSKWERPAHIGLIESDRKSGFLRDINIRIHGQESRKLLQKSFRIYTNPLYENQERFSYQIFPNYNELLTGYPAKNFETFLLRNSGTDIHRTMFRDGFVQSLLEHKQLERQAFRPAILYVNGEYWGIYNIRERVDEFFISNHFRVSADEVALLEYKANVGLVGNDEDIQDYLNLLQFISENDVSDDSVLGQVARRMDLDNFIDYQILQIFSANLDWPQNNNIFWKLRTGVYDHETKIGLDGRWRWVLTDMDFAFNSYSLNLIEHAAGDHESAFLLRSLLKNNNFRNEFLSRFADYLNTVFLTENLLGKIEDMQSAIEPEIGNHIDRWQEPPSIDEWYWNVNNMKEFAENRPETMTNQLLEYFNLSGTYQVNLSADQEMGFITVNSIDINKFTPGVLVGDNWSGTYFNEIPLSIKAVPLPGYRFVKWVSSIPIDSQTEELLFVPSNNFVLRAVFELDD